ncbi:hypothetical protein PTTG_05927 [Puccinia triticina 1-1 BBBD Race 1]|uniref:Rho-GAP domain-containing protein n=1 Tax=Puccinia triticina (isolate 1-1 / race 1 (BBBD)) TaxID=630390 RepID=A0A0C4EYM5_PUCT1|nr:hypothetical protein PTTG_05927 [Puccinia triticina 1-1 BBBD Race 1]
MEAKQFKEQQKPLPTQVATLSELSALKSVIFKHVAAMTLASESLAIKDYTSPSKLLEIIEAWKGDFWGKMFKSNINFSNDNAVQLAALLKNFLRDLPDPLLSFKLYHLVIASQTHQDTMEVLFVFLKWMTSFLHVDPEETGLKMDLQNLATVTTPNIPMHVQRIRQEMNSS